MIWLLAQFGGLLPIHWVCQGKGGEGKRGKEREEGRENKGEGSEGRRRRRKGEKPTFGEFFCKGEASLSRYWDNTSPSLCWISGDDSLQRCIPLSCQSLKFLFSLKLGQILHFADPSWSSEGWFLGKEPGLGGGAGGASTHTTQLFLLSRPGILHSWGHRCEKVKCDIFLSLPNNLYL